jgi:hypothetical protein
MNQPTSIACDLEAIPASERGRYHALRDRIFKAASGITETADGYALALASDRDMLAAVADWIALERLCCPFLRFDLTIDGAGPMRLSLGGPAGVKDLLRIELGGPMLAADRLVRRP